MREHVESLFTYIMGIGFVLYSSVLTHANEIMTVGGLILLLARAYVDVGRAVREWRRRGRSNRK